MKMKVPHPEESPLVLGAAKYPGVRFHEGLRHPLLVELAQTYADEMAAINSQSQRRQGHFGWNKRSQRIREELGLKAVEVSAQSDTLLANAPVSEVVENLYDAWRQSDGPKPLADHWGIISEAHALYGDGIAQSKQGIYYGCIIVAD